MPEKEHERDSLRELRRLLKIQLPMTSDDSLSMTADQQHIYDRLLMKADDSLL